MVKSGTPSAAAVIIGNEILSGKIRDENTPFLIDSLRRLGVALKRVSIVPDERAPLVESIADAHARFDHVFTSGGIGPTHDDITIACVAEALGRRVVRHPELEAQLRSLLGDHLKPPHLRMAEVPEGAQLVGSEGLVIPTVQVENVYILPGVPEIFREKVLSLAPRLAAAPWHARYLYVTCGEGTLAPILDAVVAGHPQVEVGSYPRLVSDGWRVRVTVESKAPEAVQAAVEALTAQLAPGALVKIEDPREASAP